jgi:riboflavin synthase alpha subunit
VFTGLVREIGRIRSLRARGGLTAIALDAPRTAGGLAVGDSLAVNGVCLTVTALAGTRVSVEASAETRRVTTLARWRVGDEVHLEPALRAGEALGGHFVLGHVDGTGRVLRVAHGQGVLRVTVGVADPLCASLVPKGSIAVDGVSLTLDAGPFRGSFTVTLIPHTLRATRFGRLHAGDAVNLEFDVLSKTATARATRGATPPTLTTTSILSKGWTR